MTVNEFRKSCCDSDCWPPEDSGSGAPAYLRINIPQEALQSGVNWIYFENESDSVYYMPCIPAGLEPYELPLYTKD
ncbi:MAG: hypothetical protein ACYTFY_13675 [Planctomycetota bacterium]